MKNIIEKAIEGGWTENEYQNKEGAMWILETGRLDIRLLVLDPLFWQALGKAYEWDDIDLKDDGLIFWSKQSNKDCRITQLDMWVNYALTFHEINLTEGWDKAVAYLEDLIK